MKKEKLIELAASAATAAGYAFHTGEMHSLNGTVRVYPAAWLAPPAVLKTTGRLEGEITYRMTLHLMTLPAYVAGEVLWDALEKDALSIAGALAADPAVCSVSGIGCTPARQSLTAHGELSVALEADITMWYYI